LPALREYHQAIKKSQPTVVNEKDVVLVHDEKPRREWKLAVIENLIRSTDGEIQAADIRTANGKTNRPISKLYPLQVTEPASTPTEIPSGPAIVPAHSRPVRKCAKKAKAAVKMIFEQEEQPSSYISGPGKCQKIFPFCFDFFQPPAIYPIVFCFHHLLFSPPSSPP
jgi:hypothetical protein